MNTQSGYSDNEGSSLSFTRTDGANRTAMQFDEVLADSQPKPQSGIGEATRIGLHEEGLMLDNP